jgi:hypothetical protein
VKQPTSWAGMPVSEAFRKSNPAGAASELPSSAEEGWLRAQEEAATQP